MYQNIYVTDWAPDTPPRVFIWDDEKGLIRKMYAEFNYAYRKDSNGTFTSLYGEPLVKMNRFSRDTPGLYESDFNREMRVLTDMYLRSDEPSKKHRTLFLDIEVSTEGGFPNMVSADKEITAISTHYKEKDEYHVWILDPKSRIPSSITDNVTTVSCSTELELVESFLDYYTTVAPTIISHWNGDMFDIPYLIHRFTNTFGKNYAQMLSPIGQFKFSEHRQRYVIAGVSSLDYMNVYKKFTYVQKPSYRLDAIAKDEVGEGKVEYEGTLDMLYNNDPAKFVEYSINDVRLLKLMDDKLKLLELVRFICHVGHVPYEDYGYSSRFIEGSIVTFLHRQGIICPNKPKVDPSFEFGTTGDTFVGAYVKPPNPQLYSWVYSLDLASLYPNVMISLNMSPEKKLGVVANWSSDKLVTPSNDAMNITLKGHDAMTMTGTEFKTFLHDHSYAVASNGAVFDQTTLGAIPTILDTWFKQRVEYKSLMKQHIKDGNMELADYYDRRQHTQKIFLNAVYGVSALPIYRFYDLDIALAVTSVGQDVIKTTAKFINASYKKRGVPEHSPEWCARYKKWLKKWKESPYVDPSDHCVYIDTDSVYFSSVPFLTSTDDAINKQLTIDVAYEYESSLNTFYATMAKRLFNCDAHRFAIKGESVMKTAFWMRKKNYAMLKVYDLETHQNIDHKVAVKGLAAVRSSFAPAFRDFMKAILLDILQQRPKEDVDTRVLQFLRDIKTFTWMQVAKNSSVKNMSKYERHIDMPRAAKTDYNIFVSGTPAHVKAAIRYNRLLTYLGVEKKYATLKDGDKLKWVKLKKNPLNVETLALKTYDDPPELVELVETYLDYDRLFEDELSKKLTQFYAALGWGKLPVLKNTHMPSMFEYVD